MRRAATTSILGIMLLAALPVPPAAADVATLDLYGWGGVVYQPRYELFSLQKVSTGGHHSAALRADGRVRCWGANDRNACDLPDPDALFLDVAAGGTYGIIQGACTVGVLTTGELVIWGDPDAAMADLPEPNEDFVAVSVFEDFGLALNGDGSLAAWGNNDQGQCDVPEPNTDFVGMVAARGYAIGIKENGRLVGWGDPVADFGQLTDLPADSGFVDVAADRHCVALRADGSIATWGRNNVDQCDIPPPNSGYIAVGAAGDRSYAIRSGGQLYCWGAPVWNDYDRPDSGEQFRAVAAMQERTVAITWTGDLRAWGDNDSGAGNTEIPHSDIVVLDAGYHDVAGITANGRVLVLGDVQAAVYASLEPGTFYRDVAVGSNDLLLMREDRSLQAVAADVTIPEPNADFISIAAGVGFFLAVRDGGSVEAWGQCGQGQCEVPEPNTGFVHVDAGNQFGVGLKTDGTVVHWGEYADLAPGPDEEFSAVAAGGFHALALRPDHSIVAWGLNNLGNLDIPEPNSDFVAIGAGYGHSLGVKSDGTVVVWGEYYLCDVVQPGVLPPLEGLGGNFYGSVALVIHITAVDDLPAAAGEPRNYPNPFNPRTTISCYLPGAAPASIRIHDLRGRLVRELRIADHAVGWCEVDWDGRDESARELPSGVYVYRVESAGLQGAMGKMTLVR